jgi:hypothetical protein
MNMKFLFVPLPTIYFLTIIVNMLKTFHFTHAECCVGIYNEPIDDPPKKKKNYEICKW